MIKTMAQEFNFDWDTVRTLEKQYMRAPRQCEDAKPQSHRHRRDFDPKRPHLPHRGRHLGSCGGWGAKSLQEGSTVNSAAALAIED